MSSPTATSPVTLAQRLQRVSPVTYRVIGPAARLVRRVGNLAMSSVEVACAKRRIRLTHEASDASHPLAVIDGCAFQEPGGGIARVWRSLLAEWAATGFSRHVLIMDRGGTAPRQPGFAYIPVPTVREPHSHSQRALAEYVCSHFKAGIFVSTGYTRPLRTRTVLLLHDMTPEVLGWNLRAARWREKHDAIRFASSYVCVSQSTLADLHRFYPTSTSKHATVALNGVDPVFRQASRSEVTRLKERLLLPDRYWLFVGRREGYKNASLLFDALNLSDAPSTTGVLLVGGAPELEPDLAEAAAHLDVRLARLDDDDLRAAYSGAAALVYPSRYEGFGLPVAEAMACGCPVITCGNSSLPEVGGDAVLYVDESDPHDLLAALHRVGKPEVRESMVRKGFAQAARFTWSGSAATLERVLREESGA